MSRPRSPLSGTLCVLGLLCLLIGACRTDGPDAMPNSADADTAVSDVASSDTSTAMSDSANRPANPPPAPAPGTARVRAEIVSCDTAATPVRCQVRVEEVLGYGSTTPPLSTGKRTMHLTSSLLSDRDVAALDALGLRTFVLEHMGNRPKLGDRPEDENPPEWTIRSIE